MNVLNRSGAIFVAYLALYLFIAGGNYFLEDFLGGDNKKSVVPIIFIIVEARRFYLKNDWYLYKLYPVGFFDRNALVILFVLYFILVFDFISLFWFLVYGVAIFLNELFMRKYYKHRVKKDAEMRELLGHLDYNAEKVKMETNRNFFKRTWIFVVLIFGSFIGMVISKQEIFYYLAGITSVLLVFFEEYNSRKISSEIQKSLGKSGICTNFD